MIGKDRTYVAGCSKCGAMGSVKVVEWSNGTWQPAEGAGAYRPREVLKRAGMYPPLPRDWAYVPFKAGAAGHGCYAHWCPDCAKNAPEGSLPASVCYEKEACRGRI